MSGVATFAHRVQNQSQRLCADCPCRCLDNDNQPSNAVLASCREVGDVINPRFDLPVRLWSPTGQIALVAKLLKTDPGSRANWRVSKRVDLLGHATVSGKRLQDRRKEFIAQVRRSLQARNRRSERVAEIACAQRRPADSSSLRVSDRRCTAAAVDQRQDEPRLASESSASRIFGRRSSASLDCREVAGPDAGVAPR